MKPSSQLTIALLAAALYALSPASRAAALTLSTDAPDLTGLSADAVSATNSTSNGESWSGTQSFETKKEERVIDHPTATTAGLAYIYDVTTVTTTRTRDTYKNDYGSRTLPIIVDAPGVSFLTWSGSLSNSSAESLSATLSIDAFGTYTSGTSGFGDTVPSLVSFYYRTSSSDTWTALSVSALADGGSFSSSAWVDWMKLAGGTTLSFEFGVLASADVSLSSVRINFYGSSYGLAQSTTTSKYSYDTLVGAKVLAAVPEPGTWAMMLAGGLALVWMGRRRSPRA